MLVVDDHRAFAEAVAKALEMEPGFQAVGVATTAEEALRSCETVAPDVALVNIGLPGTDGVGLTAQMKERCPSTRVIVITGNEPPAVLASAADAGADNFIPKSMRLSDLLSALGDSAGHFRTSPRDVPVTVQQLTPERSRTEAPELTAREREVLNLLAQGRSPKSVARELKISINTCRAHIRAILEKLGVHSQLAAVVQAGRLGLLAAES